MHLVWRSSNSPLLQKNEDQRRRHSHRIFRSDSNRSCPGIDQGKVATGTNTAPGQRLWASTCSLNRHMVLLRAANLKSVVFSATDGPSSLIKIPTRTYSAPKSATSTASAAWKEWSTTMVNTNWRTMMMRVALSRPTTFSSSTATWILTSILRDNRLQS